MKIIARNEGTLEELKQSSGNTNRLLHQISSHMTGDLPQLLSSTLTSAVETTLRTILQEEISRAAGFESETRRWIHDSERTQLQVTQSEKHRGSLQRSSSDYEEMTRDDLDENVTHALPYMPKHRARKRLRSFEGCSYQIYNTWLGTIQMRTTSLLYREEGNDDQGSNSSNSPTKATETEILILPKAWLVSRGAFVRYAREQDPWSTTVNFTFKMQHFRVVPIDSPVIMACRSGSFAEVQRLFQDRLASPFDRTQGGLTLLDVAFNTFLRLPNLKVGRHLLTPGLPPDEADPRGLLDIMSCLLRCGLDPTEIKSGMPGLLHSMPPLGRLLESDRDAVSSNDIEEVRRTEHITRLARLLIENAQNDPFENVDLTEIHADFVKNESSPVASTILTQESWYMDWDALTSWENGGPDIHWSQIVDTCTVRTDYWGTNLSLEIEKLMLAPASPRLETPGWKWPRRDAMVTDQRKIRCLALILASGYNPARVGLPGRTNRGKLLHQIMMNVEQLKWRWSHEWGPLKSKLEAVSGSPLCDKVNFENYDWAGRTRDYQMRTLGRQDYIVHRTVVKMVGLLMTCLKHGISPLSPNSDGITPTALAKKLGYLLFWIMALRKAGFDAEQIVAKDSTA
jgi:hypothetical protein